MSHEWNIDAVGRSNSSKRNKPPYERRDALENTERQKREIKMYIIIVFIEMLHLLMTDQTYFLYIKIQ